MQRLVRRAFISKVAADGVDGNHEAKKRERGEAAAACEMSLHLRLESAAPSGKLRIEHSTSKESEERCRGGAGRRMLVLLTQIRIISVLRRRKALSARSVGRQKRGEAKEAETRARLSVMRASAFAGGRQSGMRPTATGLLPPPRPAPRDLLDILEAL